MFCSEKVQWSRLYRDHKCFISDIEIKDQQKYLLRPEFWNKLRCLYMLLSIHEFTSVYDFFDYLRWICISSSINLCTFSQVFGIFEITFQFEVSSFPSPGYFLFCNFNISQLLDLRTSQVIFTQQHKNRKKCFHRTHASVEMKTRCEQQTLGPSPQSQPVGVFFFT